MMQKVMCNEWATFLLIVLLLYVIILVLMLVCIHVVHNMMLDNSS